MVLPSRVITTAPSPNEFTSDPSWISTRCQRIDVGSSSKRCRCFRNPLRSPYNQLFSSRIMPPAKSPKTASTNRTSSNVLSVSSVSRNLSIALPFAQRDAISMLAAIATTHARTKPTTDSVEAVWGPSIGRHIAALPTQVRADNARSTTLMESVKILTVARVPLLSLPRHQMPDHDGKRRSPCKAREYQRHPITHAGLPLHVEMHRDRAKPHREPDQEDQGGGEIFTSLGLADSHARKRCAQFDALWSLDNGFYWNDTASDVATKADLSSRRTLPSDGAGTIGERQQIESCTDHEQTRADAAKIGPDHRVHWIFLAEIKQLLQVLFKKS